MDYVMYIFVNDDLKMGKGKIASQVGHCVQNLIEELLENNKKEKYQDYIKWKNGSKKIILKATYSQLVELQKNDIARSVYDAGHTQIESNSLTVVGFFPSNKLRNVFKEYKLL